MNYLLTDPKEVDHLIKYKLAPVIKFTKCHEDARLDKQRDTDAGLDLNLVDVKKIVGDVVFFGTGIKVQPPPDYYFELAPRSSICKTQWILANSIGIIDQEYRGEIIVPLRYFGHHSMQYAIDKLELPIKMVQLILRKQPKFHLYEVEELDETSRGDRGFGSSGK